MIEHVVLRLPEADFTATIFFVFLDVWSSTSVRIYIHIGAAIFAMRHKHLNLASFFRS